MFYVGIEYGSSVLPLYIATKADSTNKVYEDFNVISMKKPLKHDK